MINSSAILEVNLKNLVYNFKILKKIAKNSIIAATIKSNAYGIGDKKVYSCLYKQGCRHFFVATVKEGYDLRKKFKKGNIYILNGLENYSCKIFINNNLIPIINSDQEIKKVIKYKFSFGLHWETGLNRLGINKLKNIIKINKNQNIKIIISHLSSSDEKNNPYNKIQNNNFHSFKKLFNNKNIIYSLANSMAINLGPNYHHDLVRPGISLYGGHYNLKMKKIIKPVVKLKARILQIKQILKNQYIGYNQTFKTNKSIFVAIIGIGYGDGISRKLSNSGDVFYKGYKFKILGRVSMDSITIDITKKKNLFKMGNYVEIINYLYGIDYIANKCETISNEIITSLTNRVERIYKY